jgi:hypothetical protein
MKLATAYLGFKLRRPLIPSASPLSEKLDNIRVLEREMREWMEDPEYESIEQIKGIMSRKNCPDPTAFERAQYTRALKSNPRNQSSTAQDERDGTIKAIS